MTTLEISSPLQEKIESVGQLIGNTPLYPITAFPLKEGVQLFAKLEWQQLGQSVKARPAFQIIKDAISRGELYPGKKLLDASSGNTAIAYASIGAALGLEVVICLPANASAARKRILKALGAGIILTSPSEGTDGAQHKAKELVSQQPSEYYYADQYNNDSNWRAHYYTTAREIYHQTNGQITHFITGLGTTGSFMGTSRKLKEINPGIRTISLQPETALHGLEGWKDMETAKVPGIYDTSLADENRLISTGKAYEWLKKFAAKEGMILSPSAAANLAGAYQLAEEIDSGIIVTLFPDDASKYGELIDQLIS